MLKFKQEIAQNELDFTHFSGKAKMILRETNILVTSS